MDQRQVAYYVSLNGITRISVDVERVDKPISTGMMRDGYAPADSAGELTFLPGTVFSYGKVDKGWSETWVSRENITKRTPAGVVVTNDKVLDFLQYSDFNIPG